MCAKAVFGSFGKATSRVQASSQNRPQPQTSTRKGRGCGSRRWSGNVASRPANNRPRINSGNGVDWSGAKAPHHSDSREYSDSRRGLVGCTACSRRRVHVGRQSLSGRGSLCLGRCAGLACGSTRKPNDSVGLRSAAKAKMHIACV